MTHPTTTPPQPTGPAPKTRKPISLKPLVLLAVVGVLSAGGVLLYDHFGRTVVDPFAPDEGLEALTVPAFSMTTQSGAEFTREDLLGHLTVMDFFFTNCPAICPALSRSMKRIQDTVGDRGVRLVSVSVDPQNDTVDTLLAHAAEIGADTDVWTFLRADDFEQVRRLSEDGLKLGLSLDGARAIKLDSGGEMPWIDHTGKLVLLDANANVIGLYSGLNEFEVDALIQRLALAADLQDAEQEP